jgi:sugar/nucleoside kinase (ribokinase family)/D-arabinose 5-phosphate isomerase GutQ
MVLDRVHRSARIVGPDEKGILTGVEDFGPVGHYIGGVVLNHLGWAATLGLETGIFGRQADDDRGRTLRRGMDRLGIERHLSIEGSSSSVAEIFVDDLGQRAIYMAPGATSGTTPDLINDEHASFIRRASCMTTEISQLPLAAVAASLRVAQESRVMTIVDFDVPPSEALATLGDKQTLEEILNRAQILKPSKAAAQEYLGGNFRDPLAIARAMRLRLHNEAVIVTDGAAGCAIASDDFEGFVPGVPAKAVDTTGAGDAFMGGLVAGLHYGLDWQTTGRLANACGAACAEQLGGFPEDPLACRARILEFFQDRDFEPEPFKGQSATASRDAGLMVLETGAREMTSLHARYDEEEGRDLCAAADLIDAAAAAGGRVHVTGVGKAEHVAHYAASLMASTGVPSTFLQATEGLHGSLGQIVPGDIVIAVSNSGETSEILHLVGELKQFRAPVIAVTGIADSSLSKVASVTLDASVASEGGPLGLAPRASVAAQVLVLAALGAVLQERRDFTKAEYAQRHPSGKLGERARS